jgi:hypothetical protein
VSYFYFQLMQLHDVDLSLLADENEGFTPELGQLFFEETRRFIDEVTWQGPGDLATLLTAPFTFLNGPLAEFHGIDGVSGDDFERVDLDPERRAGLLTQPSVLSSTSYGTLGRVTLRGRLVLEQLLCVDLPAAPESHSQTFLANLPAEPTRSLYEANLVDPSCSVTCHQLTDPLGFPFLNYDAVGRWQDSEFGETIDASAEIDLGDVSGTYIGARELAEALAASRDVRDCFLNKWMVFAYGREETPDDACTRQVLTDSFDASGGRVRDLLVALTQTDAFVYRPVVEP